MSYLNYDGLAYFKSKLTNWVDQNYLSKTNTGNLTVAGHVTFTNPITGDLDGKAKKDWLGQKIDETYIKSIATNDNAGTIVYTKGNGSTNHILIDLLQGATPIANGRAGLVPAPTVSEMNYFLRGDGNWAVPTDVYVNQNLIASSNNNQFPVLLSGTSGTPATKTNATVGYTNVVSVNPMTNALMASQFISKHPTYNRQNAITSKIQYSLNFTDIVSGAGHNLGEVVGYVDTVANGGEHELGLRLFGNPNVQGTEEDYVYMGVGLSKTNVAYGHAPSTPLPSAHNEPTDIITRDWLARNGSETGLVHTSMNETIGGIKTFTDETRNTSTAGITTTKLTASGKITGTGTAEISGGSGSTPSLKVTGNETVTGDLSVGGSETITGNISTTSGNISTTNGTVSGKTGSIGTGGLTVTGPSNLNGKVTAGNGLDVTGNTETDTLTVNGNETVGGTLTVTGKITGNGGAAISGGNGLQVTGNETVSGNLTVGGTTTTDDLSVTDDATIDDTLTVGGQVLKKTGTNTTQEYVSYITNQEGARNTIINNLIKTDGGLAQDSNHNIYVKTGDGVQLSDGYVTTRLKSQGGITYDGSTANSRSLKLDLVDGGGIKYHAATTEEPYSGLVVDFSGTSAVAQNIADQMKAELLSSLGLQIPLTGNKSFYVNPLHENSTDGWRSSKGVVVTDVGTQAKPFKTIQAAVNCATQGYSVGAYTVTIYVTSYDENASDYNLDSNVTGYSGSDTTVEGAKYFVKDHVIGYMESLTCPSYNGTSGFIRIRPVDYAHPVLLDRKNNVSSNCCSVNGRYRFVRIHFRNNVNYDTSENYNSFIVTFNVGNDGIAEVYGCIFTSKFLGTRTGTHWLEYRVINVNEGSLYMRAMYEDGGYPSEFYFDKGTANDLDVFEIWENSLVDFPSVSTYSDGLFMIAEGTCGSFITCSGTCRATGGGFYAQSFRRWEGVDTAAQYDLPNDAVDNATSYHLVSGKKYIVSGGGHCAAPRTGFPGSIRGTVNSETYSVYTGSSNDYNWNSSSLDTVIGD